MSLLPGGERGSRLYQLAFALFVITGGYEGFMYFHAVSSVDGNIASLGDDISLNGEAHFRRELVRSLDLNGVLAEASNIEVTFRPEANVYEVVVPARWTIDLPWKRLELHRTFRARVPRRDDLTQP